MTDPRYPIGPFVFDPATAEQNRTASLHALAEFPMALRRAVEGWNDQKLNTPYREGGWTVRQVIHHVADSHMNGYIRLKLSLTEEQPTVKPYLEARWAEIPEARTAKIEPSLDLLVALHQRWILTYATMTAADFQRTMLHPENGVLTLERHLALYAWHSRHHLAHVTTLAERMGW